MSNQVSFVELTIYERLFPLVSGYLQAYACQEPVIKKAFSFEKYSTTVKTPYLNILRDLQNSDSEVYAFSCYIWNMGLVKSLLAQLLVSKPNAYFILGGPQVMHQADQYLNKRHENLVICNGEGERTFAEFLQELTNNRPDFSNVRGLSFYRDGNLITTEKHERIKVLDEIPSPFLDGIFDKPYSISIFETNRGCPFSCGFCYWGAATNSKVFTFDENRIRDEITWLSKHNCICLYIADANWGIYPRDVGLSEHIADMAKRNKMPGMIYYSAAKNRPERVTQITEIFTNAGIITSQPVSLQTMSDATLAAVDRKNIKLSAYKELQDNLTAKKISSYTELIWPLPGETLSSFKEGIDKLCEARADTIMVYPQLLLHNTTLYHRRNELGFVTKRVDDEIGEADIVIQTAEVSFQEFQEGIYIYYACHLLHNIRSLLAVSSYLNKKRQVKYSDLFSAFADFCKECKGNSLVEICEKSIQEYGYYDTFDLGKVVHFALHEYRGEFDELLYQFVSTQPWWDDPQVRIQFEIDLLNKPYVYSNTPIIKKDHALVHLRITDTTSSGYIVEFPEEHLSSLYESIGVEEKNETGGTVFRVDHKRRQYPFMKSQSLVHNAGYCQAMILRIEHIMPIWTRGCY
jgi:radical SAM superfamily enzyme YgiQ (UPF0313 family)